MVRVWGLAAPVYAGPPAGGMGNPSHEAATAYGVLVGDGSPSTAGPPAGGTGCPAQEAVSAYGAPAGDGSPHRRGPTSRGDGESYLGGGHCQWSAC